MNCSILVLVRTASTRLPNKALLTINKTPLILKLIRRISKSDNTKKIIVCTTKLKSDDQLVKLLEKNNIPVYRGETKDILKRLHGAAKNYDLDKFVVVEGDDIFCDPELIKKTCNFLSTTKNELILWENLPFGVSPIGMKTEKLEKLIKESNTKNAETGWHKFVEESGLFKISINSSKKKKICRPDIRLTVDYIEDFELAKGIYEKLDNEFSLEKIIDLIDKNPNLHKINQFAQDKWEKNFKKKSLERVFVKNKEK
jgi:spore coat polysaccharide biosynthesis protein SpsF